MRTFHHVFFNLNGAIPKRSLSTKALYTSYMLHSLHSLLGTVSIDWRESFRSKTDWMNYINLPNRCTNNSTLNLNKSPYLKLIPSYLILVFLDWSVFSSGYVTMSWSNLLNVKHRNVDLEQSGILSSALQGIRPCWSALKFMLPLTYYLGQYILNSSAVPSLAFWVSSLLSPRTAFPDAGSSLLFSLLSYILRITEVGVKEGESCREQLVLALL